MRPGGKSALRHQFHGPVDGNSHHTGLLVYPTVTVQGLFFLQAEGVDLHRLVGFQPRLGKFRDVTRLHHPRICPGLLHQRTLVRLIPILSASM